MKIGVLTPSVSRLAGGLFWSVRELAIEMQQCGHHIEVFSVHDTHTEEDLKEWGDIRVNVFQSRGPVSFSYAPGLKEAFTQFAPEIIHTHGLWTYMSVVAEHTAARLDSPLFISPRGMLDAWALKRARLKKWFAMHAYEMRHLKRATCLHALNPAEARSIEQLKLTGRVITIPNGTRLPSLSSVTPELFLKNEKRRKLLFLSRIHPKKGLVPLIEGWALAKSQDPDFTRNWCLAVAGWDQLGHQSMLQSLAEKLGVSNDIHFVGPLFGDAKLSALLSSSAFILPSYSEGLPVAVLEAWAAGLPVLMTDACNLPEGFSKNAARRLQPNGQSVQAALMWLNTACELELQTMSDNAKRLVVEDFQWSQIARRLLTAYDESLCSK